MWCERFQCALCSSLFIFRESLLLHLHPCSDPFRTFKPWRLKLGSFRMVLAIYQLNTQAIPLYILVALYSKVRLALQVQTHIVQWIEMSLSVRYRKKYICINISTVRRNLFDSNILILSCHVTRTEHRKVWVCHEIKITFIP